MAPRSEPGPILSLLPEELPEARTLTPDKQTIDAASEALRSIHELLDPPTDNAITDAARVLTALPPERQKRNGEKLDPYWLLVQSMALGETPLESIVDALETVRRMTANTLELPGGQLRFLGEHDARLSSIDTRKKRAMQAEGDILFQDIQRLSAQAAVARKAVSVRMRAMSDKLRAMEPEYLMESTVVCPNCETIPASSTSTMGIPRTTYCCNTCDWQASGGFGSWNEEEFVRESDDGYRPAGYIPVTRYGWIGKGAPPTVTPPYGTAAGWAKKLLPRSSHDYLPPSLSAPFASGLEKSSYSEYEIDDLKRRRQEFLSFLERARAFAQQPIPETREELIGALELPQRIEREARERPLREVLLTPEALTLPDRTTWYGKQLMKDATIEELRLRAAALDSRIAAVGEQLRRSQFDARQYRDALAPLTAASVPMTGNRYVALLQVLENTELQIAEAERKAAEIIDQRRREGLVEEARLLAQRQASEEMEHQWKAAEQRWPEIQAAMHRNEAALQRFITGSLWLPPSLAQLRDPHGHPLGNYAEEDGQKGKQLAAFSVPGGIVRLFLQYESKGMQRHRGWKVHMRMELGDFPDAPADLSSPQPPDMPPSPPQDRENPDGAPQEPSEPATDAQLQTLLNNFRKAGGNDKGKPVIGAAANTAEKQPKNKEEKRKKTDEVPPPVDTMPEADLYAEHGSNDAAIRQILADNPDVETAFAELEQADRDLQDALDKIKCAKHARDAAGSDKGKRQKALDFLGEQETRRDALQPRVTALRTRTQQLRKARERLDQLRARQALIEAKLLA